MTGRGSSSPRLLAPRLRSARPASRPYGAQFHMDVTPGVPNAAAARAILERMNHDPSWATTAIAITNMESPSYPVISDDWLRSNPMGYRRWFHSRMAAVFEERKKALQK